MPTVKLAALCGLILAASTGFAQETLAPEAWKDFVNQLRGSTERVDEISELGVPWLYPRKEARRWGEPETFRRSPDGGYWIVYRNPDPDRPFERVEIIASPKPIPRLSSVPDEIITTLVDGELRDVSKPQAGHTTTVRWRSPEGRIEKSIRYFRAFSGGGANGPLYITDSFQLTAGGKTGYYVVSVETVTGATEERLESLAVKETP